MKRIITVFLSIVIGFGVTIIYHVIGDVIFKSLKMEPLKLFVKGCRDLEHCGSPQLITMVSVLFFLPPIVMGIFTFIGTGAGSRWRRWLGNSLALFVVLVILLLVFAYLA
ncbi:hypothetical protein HGO41_24045 [Rahnella sp. CG8]|uniref:hypothetical protein n=1 Tax=Rahnella sp. CG8 TaxID=2726078 RepID=UPI0020337DD5|nr:hypothetical protein [Rahnella sp. CG8]MCM2448228.1 hypothetical protein [Rahnella sp. CG8]